MQLSGCRPLPTRHHSVPNHSLLNAPLCVAAPSPFILMQQPDITTPRALPAAASPPRAPFFAAAFDLPKDFQPIFQAVFRDPGSARWVQSCHAIASMKADTLEAFGSCLASTASSRMCRKWTTIYMQAFATGNKFVEVVVWSRRFSTSAFCTSRRHDHLLS